MQCQLTLIDFTRAPNPGEEGKPARSTTLDVGGAPKRRVQTTYHTLSVIRSCNPGMTSTICLPLHISCSTPEQKGGRASQTAS